jgi:4-hydroxyphenylpyruvate dioxygenase
MSTPRDARAAAATNVIDRPQPLGLHGVDHLEWWVGNARQAAAFWSGTFGFAITGYAGPETGVMDRVSYLLEQGTVRFVVTGALHPESLIASHHRLHGDGVRDVAFTVTSAQHAYEEALRRGAVGLRAPWAEETEAGKIVRATIAAYGDTSHTFVERSAYSGLFAPGFEAPAISAHAGAGGPVGIGRIDHVVANVELGSLDRWVSFYERVLGFDQLTHFSDDQISTEYSALMSTVVWDGSRIVLPINEPAEGRRKSQIEEYLDFYRSAGVQHVALRTDDIVGAVRELRERGLRFIDVPPTYYDEAKQRMVGVEGLPWDELAQLGILVDRDQDGYLLQTFTETVTDRPCVFIEVIQREGARGFGEGNFKALFEAIEREQARRGNL